MEIFTGNGQLQSQFSSNEKHENGFFFYGYCNVFSKILKTIQVQMKTCNQGFTVMSQMQHSDRTGEAADRWPGEQVPWF